MAVSTPQSLVMSRGAKMKVNPFSEGLLSSHGKTFFFFKSIKLLCLLYLYILIPNTRYEAHENGG
jgi:hypothetical protein